MKKIVEKDKKIKRIEAEEYGIKIRINRKYKITENFIKLMITVN